ncbi:phosphoglycerate mutase [Nitrosospira sp. NpAV]|uniref:phosphoglycerate mutase n=1 Tax=Nitrosospira sp. NpAV TaxID=58133 RepID=UPI0005A25084|nr:phosphoglycerate mutase [Nitrosospira sp. NpAV]KIO49300.1 phosphoglycerate mutase [Nitrosospira sp. NpAV]
MILNLHLLIPSLFWPDASLPEIYRDLPLPGLESLLAKSLRTEDKPVPVEAWLCRAFGVPKQRDWPVAPITLDTDGAGSIKVGGDYWVRADPVHLRIERDQILLGDSRVFRISMEEAEQFTRLLNQHFAGSGQEMVFVPIRPDRWYLRATAIPPAETHLLSEVVNKGINELLPFGTNNTSWHALFNEVQMVLHEHPLNQSREARGEPAINGTWFWGGGVMPQSMTSPYTHVWSDDVLAAALALASGITHMRLPLDATAWRESAVPGDHFIVLDSLHGRAQYADAYGWRESLKELERNWFAPLWSMSRQGKLDQLTLTSISHRKTQNFVLRKSDTRKFWRRTQSFSSYAQ